MDMSAFRRNRTSSRRLDLSVLLAGVAARQASTPTARAMILTGRAAAPDEIPNEIAPFLGLRGTAGPAVARSPSFNAAAREALLTSGKGS